MKASEVESIFNQMPSSDRLYLLCKLLHGSVTYELNFLSIVLQSYLKERLNSVSEIHEDANSPSYYSTKFSDTKIASKEPLEILSACLSLIRHDNQQVGSIIYKLLNQPDILSMAEEIEDLGLFENLRLVYIMGVYHPSIPFRDRHRLLTVYLHQLDEIYNSKVAERNAREAEERELAFDQNRPTRPSDTAHITKCQLIGFFKRQSDRRYAYVIEVEWSDGANCSVQRTYGDFFGFQNKLLDLFPEESGQKSKKSRLIPFLPGRRLLSGKSNRELAEKRLPDLWSYTNELFLLPKRISSCKHVQDFFRPLLSDSNDISSLPKLITLSEIRESTSSKSRHPSAPAGVTLATTSSPKSRSGFLNSLTSSRNSHTLPPGKSPESQRDAKINKHATMPNQSAFVPISSNTPSSSTERLNSSSQTSLGSTDRLQVVATTTACQVVTPPTSRKNGSPAFAVSNTNSLASSSWSNTHAVMNGDKEVKKHDEDVLPPSSTNMKVFQGGQDTDVPDTITTSPSTQITIPSSSTVVTTTNQVSSWAECSPPATTDTSFYFSTHSSPSNSTTLSSTNNTSIFRPIQSTPTKRAQKITLSPSLSQLQQYGGGSQPTYHNYPVSYTHTRFDSHSPSSKQSGEGMGGGKWQSTYGPLCTTPTNETPTESNQLRKWLKVHRLHKYEHLFKDLTFEDISKLSVEQLKNMGMTLGGAKKLQQKMEELKQINIHSFCDIPQTSLTRKPSTSSLPAALLLQDRQGGMTPSTSIDQLSLNDSVCSLDVLGGGSQPNENETTPHNDHVISKVDRAIVEAGPVNGGMCDDGSKSGVSSRKVQTNVVRSKSSQGAMYSNGGSSSRSMDNTPSHSPLKVQRSLSPHHYHRHSPAAASPHTQFNGSSPNRSSVPAPQQIFSTPQFHRKDIHSMPTAIGDHHRHPPPKIPPALLPHNRLPNWPIATAQVLHGGGPSMAPHSAPIICGRVQLPPPPAVYPQTINGIVQQATPPPASINHLGHVTYHQRVPSYPINGPHSGMGGVKHSNNVVSCYNCGMAGHLGSSCPNNIIEEYKKTSTSSVTPILKETVK